MLTRRPLQRIVADASAAGLAATAASTAAMMVISLRRDASPWPVLNSVSHIAWGNEAGARREPSVKYTLTGAALNTAAVLSWSLIFAGAQHVLPRRSPAAIGSLAAATAGLAYVVDYHVVPRRLTPGFELRLPRRWFAPIYVSLAAGLAIGALVARGRRYPAAVPPTPDWAIAGRRAHT